MLFLDNTPMGKMEIVDVFIYYDGPKLFVCQSEGGVKYLVNWTDTEDGKDTWYFVPVSEERLSQIKTGIISIYNSTKNAEDGWLIIITSTPDNKSTATLAFTNNLKEDDLPDEDTYLTAFLADNSLNKKFPE